MEASRQLTSLHIISSALNCFEHTSLTHEPRSHSLSHLQASGQLKTLHSDLVPLLQPCLVRFLAMLNGPNAGLCIVIIHFQPFNHTPDSTIRTIDNLLPSHPLSSASTQL